jgi:hypothetical protein
MLAGMCCRSPLNMVLQNTERLIQSLRGGKAEQVLTDLHTAVAQALDIAQHSSAHQPLISPLLELQAAAQQLRRDGHSNEQITSCLEELLTEVKDLYAWKTGMLFLTEYSDHFETFLCVVVKELPAELVLEAGPTLHSSCCQSSLRWMRQQRMGRQRRTRRCTQRCRLSCRQSTSPGRSGFS